MLREILTTGFIDKNLKMHKGKYCTPGKQPCGNKNLMNTFNINSNSPDSNEINSIRKPIMEKKINIIMNRPDFFNSESTFQTTTNNRQIISNKKIHNIISPLKISNLNKKSKKLKNFSQNEINDNDEIFKYNIEGINNIINKNSDKKTKEEENKSNNKSNSKLFEIDMSMLSSEGMEKIKLLEEYISKIKENSSNINEIKIQKLQNDKITLENKVNILTNNIRLNQKIYKNNIKNKNILQQEKEKVKIDTNKANKEAFLLLKELPINRGEIELMKNQIAQAKEETKYINNYSIEIDGQTSEIQDEIKKYNVKITNIIKEKDKISNEIISFKKKCKALKNKIDKIEKSSNEFLFNVGELAKLALNNNK